MLTFKILYEKKVAEIKDIFQGQIEVTTEHFDFSTWIVLQFLPFSRHLLYHLYDCSYLHESALAKLNMAYPLDRFLNAAIKFIFR